MTSFAIKALVGLVLVYVLAVALLFTFQRSVIYPAPQARAPLTPGYEEALLETEDGLELRAIYREAEPGLPTVLYFHGNGGSVSGASVSNAPVVEAGIGALLVEYRGYGGNPGEPSEQGLYRDGEAAMRWLSDRGVRGEDIVVVGNSIGGGVATHIASEIAQTGDGPAGLILIAPFTSVPDVAADALWWAPARWLVRDRFDNRSRVAELDLPLLVQHGDADRVIGDHHGKTLAAAASDATFQPFAGSGHALSFERRSGEARRDWILALER